jgi:hypothetical protein
MKKFFKYCESCDGTGTQGETITAPYNSNDVVEWTCEECNGECQILDIDELECRLFEVKEMIDGLSIRIGIFKDMANKCRLGYLDSLANKFENRIDTLQRGIKRLTEYKFKLESL